MPNGGRRNRWLPHLGARANAPAEPATGRPDAREIHPFDPGRRNEDNPRLALAARLTGGEPAPITAD